MFSARCLWHPKDAGFVNEYEDAFAVDPERGFAAVADGVSSAIFSRQWARILTAAAVASPPPSFAWEDFQPWLKDLRSQWLETIDFAKLDYFKKEKLRQVGGAFATLLWFQLEPVDADLQDELPRFRLRAGAMGDCCLFHIRAGALIATFPMVDAEGFKGDPVSICSVNRGVGGPLPIETAELNCQQGDIVILATDAIAACAFQHYEAGSSFDWDEYWDISPANWVARIAELRATAGMRYDDTTLVLMRVGAEPNTEVVAPPAPGDELEMETVDAAMVDEEDAACQAESSGTSEETDHGVVELADEGSTQTECTEPIERTADVGASGESEGDFDGQDASLGEIGQGSNIISLDEELQ